MRVVRRNSSSGKPLKTAPLPPTDDRPPAPIGQLDRQRFLQGFSDAERQRFLENIVGPGLTAQKKAIDRHTEQIAEQRQLITELRAEIASLRKLKGVKGRDGRDGVDGKDGKDGKDVPTKSITVVITRDGAEETRVDVPLDRERKVVEVQLESTKK